MLRITQQDSSKDAKRYYTTADYYTQGQELVGSWGGKGAARLGLSGTVDQFSFERLCDNLNPMTGESLTVRTRTDRTVGYDFTFSVPKSVSLLYAMSGDQEILTAFRSAVDETMHDIEAEMKTRVRKGGRDENRLTGNMVWAEFVHTTSRPVDGVPDPQLHAHVFAFNSTFDEKEVQWKAGQFRELKRDAPYFQAGFRVRLANKLQDLGFDVERKRDDFEVSGVSAGLLKRFSRRTDLIEKVAADRGITDPKIKDGLGAETREKKNKDMGWESLRREWDSRLTHDERQTLAAVHRRETPVVRFAPGEEMAVDYAIDHTFTRDSVAPERKLQTEALKRGIGSVTVEGVKQELAKRPLILGEYAGRVMATIRDVVTSESRLIAFARKGRGKFRPLGDPNRPLSRSWLNEGQVGAVRHVLGSRDRVSIIRGAAGTGKTTLEQEIGEALTESGVRVVALAPSAAASRGVLREEAGFALANTIARFQQDKEMQESAKNGVILVDEASLLSTREMLRLFEKVESLDARLILVGDQRQHRSVLAGEPLKLLEKAGLPVVEVTEIMRQSGDYRKATLALSENRTEDGLTELDKLGWIMEVSGKDRYQELASAYIEAVQEKKRNGETKTALVVSPTHAEAGQITRCIREDLRAKGKLGEERTLDAWAPAHLSDAQKTDAAQYETGDMLQFYQNAPGHKIGSRLLVSGLDEVPLQHPSRFEVYRPVKLAIAAGDRIRVTARGKTKDGKHQLENGSLYTVKGFNQQGDVVIDHNWVIPREFGHVALGYVVTSHASQGRTVDKVFIGQSSQSFPASNQRQFYVSVSRAKEQAVVFTDDKKALWKAVERPDEPLSATEFLKSRRKLPVRRRLSKHLVFLRRLDTFAQTHESRPRDENRTPEPEREIRHGR
jgi:conjugative relaxase-like TrwC/TraI family protein